MSQEKKGDDSVGMRRLHDVASSAPPAKLLISSHDRRLCFFSPIFCCFLLTDCDPSSRINLSSNFHPHLMQLIKSRHELRGGKNSQNESLFSCRRRRGKQLCVSGISAPDTNVISASIIIPPFLTIVKKRTHRLHLDCVSALIRQGVGKEVV